MKSRLISASLVLVMLLTLLPVAVMAQGGETADPPVITLSSPKVYYETGATSIPAGTEFTVDVSISANSGIVTATIPVVWNPDVLELTEIVYTDNSGAYGLHQLTGRSGDNTNYKCIGWIGADIEDSGCNESGVYYLAWDNDLATEEFNGEKLCAMKFKLVKEMALTATADITVVMDEGAYAGSGSGEVSSVELLPIENVMTQDMHDFAPDMGNAVGTLTFEERTFMVGDISNDQMVDIVDVIVLLRYVVGGYDVRIDDIRVGDIFLDNTIDIVDVITLLRYVVGGYGVELPRY